MHGKVAAMARVTSAGRGPHVDVGAKGQVPAYLLGVLWPRGEVSWKEGGWVGLEKPMLWLWGQGHVSRRLVWRRRALGQADGGGMDGLDAPSRHRPPPVSTVQNIHTYKNNTPRTGGGPLRGRVSVSQPQGRRPGGQL